MSSLARHVPADDEDDAVMTTGNRRLVDGLIAAIDSFRHGETSLGEVHVRLQSAIPMFEREPASPERAVRLAEADLEEIRFARPLAEQWPAATSRLGELRAVLAVALAGSA